MLQILRLQHGVSGNSPLEGAGKSKGKQSLGSDEPSVVQDKAAHSCSRDLWEKGFSHPLEMAGATEGIYIPAHKELEASPVPTAGSNDVWVVDRALSEAISAGLFCAHARTLGTLPKKCERRPSFQLSAEVLVTTYINLHEIMNHCELRNVTLQWSSCSCSCSEYGSVAFVSRRNRHLAVQVCQNQGAQSF